MMEVCCEWKDIGVLPSDDAVTQSTSLIYNVASDSFYYVHSFRFLMGCVGFIKQAWEVTCLHTVSQKFPT